MICGENKMHKDVFTQTIVSTNLPTN